MNKTQNLMGDDQPSSNITTQGEVAIQNYIATGQALTEVEKLTLKIKGKFDQASFIVENIRQRKYKAISENDHDEEIMARQDEEFYKGRRQAFSNVLFVLEHEVTYI